MSSGGSADNNQISFARELARKGTHMFALVIPGGYYLFDLNKAGMLAIMIPIACTMILIDISRLRLWKFWTVFAHKLVDPMVRQHEADGDFTGATYILTTVCFTVAMFDKPIAIAALAFIVVGDTFAALVGRKFGRHRFWNGKSLEGSTACLVATLIVAALTPGLAWQVSIVGAVVATVAEALPLGVDDNVTVPIMSGLAMTLLTRVLAFV